MSILNDGIMQLNAPLQHKRGTSKALSSSEYIPAAGEIITAIDTGEIKAGDGIHTWGHLHSNNSSIELVTEIHTLTSEEVASKALTLTNMIAQGSEANVRVFICGVAQFAGIDFTVSGNSINWEGKGLDDINLKAGDLLIIQYVKE